MYGNYGTEPGKAIMERGLCILRMQVSILSTHNAGRIDIFFHSIIYFSILASTLPPGVGVDGTRVLGVGHTEYRGIFK